MNYWIIINNERIGPKTLEELSALHITEDTPVWRNGLTNWCAAGLLPELAAYIGRPAPAVAPQPEAEPVAEETTEEVVEETTDEIAEEEVVVEDEVEEAIADRPADVTEEPAVATPAAPVIPVAPVYVVEPHHEEPIPERPKSYLVWSILSLIFCCMIPSVVAIIYSAKVGSLYDRGDYKGAQRASETAQWWIIISIVAGLIWMPFNVVLSLMS